jgi:hypothetical protein
MPASMVHLLLARKVYPDAPTLFYIGNIAPDAVTEWKIKDKTHFRDIEDRTDTMRDLALGLDLSDAFSNGVLLHLFLDWKWDIGPFEKFKAEREGTDWFKDYRHELSLSGIWLYHRLPWSKALWKDMAETDPSRFGKLDYVTREDIGRYIRRNYHWHEENDCGPSSVFTPEFVNSFTDKTALNFIEWKKEIGLVK